jgi:hypothetical protein
VWAQYRTDLRGFARLAHYEIPVGPDASLARRLQNGAAYVPSIGVEPDTFALLLCWRIACWPCATTLVVTPTLQQARKLFERANVMMQEADEALRERVLFTARNEGMLCAVSSVVGAVHCNSGTLGLGLPDSKEPLTFVIPNLDLVPGCHQRYLPLLLSRPGTVVVANCPRRGKVL